MLSFIMLIVIMLTVIMLAVVLSVSHFHPSLIFARQARESRVNVI